MKHFASTETIVEERLERESQKSKEVADDNENKNEKNESEFDVSNDEIEDPGNNDNFFGKSLLNRSRSLNDLSNDTTTVESISPLNNIEVYNLPFLKESRVDEIDEIGCVEGDSGAALQPSDTIEERKISTEESLTDEKSLLNDTLDSDLVNITFSDEHVQNLLHRTPSGKTIKSSGDDSFEVLPSFDEDLELKPCQIENTLDESSTDLDSNNTTLNELDQFQMLPRTQLDSAQLSLDDAICNNVIQQDVFLQADSVLTETDNLNESTLDTNNNTFESNGFLSVESNDNTVGSNSNMDLSGTIEDDNMESKRRAVSVDNSQLTPSRTRRYAVNKTSKTHVKHDQQNIKRSHSMSDLLDVNRKREKKFNKRKGFSSKLYRSGSISNILDDFFEEKAKTLSHEHWAMVVSTPEKWFYCWHPLLGVNNLLSNWQ